MNILRILLPPIAQEASVGATVGGSRGRKHFEVETPGGLVSRLAGSPLFLDFERNRAGPTRDDVFE